MGAMDTARGLQEVVSRNVRVLMAVHDITSQKELVARLGDGWEPSKLTRSLNGSRKWALEDLPDIARAFGVTPAALLSDTTDLVGLASHPAAAGYELRRGVSGGISPR
jgi:DNA-binding transcriptional regulator YdaS (Cro superfamily)